MACLVFSVSQFLATLGKSEVLTYGSSYVLATSHLHCLLAWLSSGMRQLTGAPA